MEKKVNEQRKHEESLESIRKRTALVQRQKRPIEESVIATRVKASLVCDLLNNSRFNKYHNQTSFSFNAEEGTVFMKTLCDCTDADEPLEKPLVDVDALQRDICSFFGLSADTNSFMATKLAEGTHFSIGRAVVDQIMGIWVSRMLNTTVDFSEYSNNRRFSYNKDGSVYVEVENHDTYTPGKYGLDETDFRNTVNVFTQLDKQYFLKLWSDETNYPEFFHLIIDKDGVDKIIVDNILSLSLDYMAHWSGSIGK